MYLIKKNNDWNHEMKLLECVFKPFGMQRFHKIQDGIVYPLNLGTYTSHTVDRFTFYNSM